MSTLATFDPTRASELEVNAAYKAAFAETMEEHGVADGWLLPRTVVHALQESLRQWWKAWYATNDSEVKRAERQERARQRRDDFEARYGVSDKAPPRVQAPARSPQEPGAGLGVLGLGLDASPARSARTGASIPTPSPAAPPARPSAAPARRPAPPASLPADAESPMNFGTAADVDRAIASIFGHNLED